MATHAGVNGALSVHFTADEFKCPHCGVALVRPSLIQVLERVRRLSGHPLLIVSGYRCPVHNPAVGGALNSQHMYGAAADIHPRVVRPEEAWRCGAVGIGLDDQGWVVHVDVRDGARTSWTYGRH